MRATLTLTLILLATPLAVATHTEGATCTPWTPTLDGRERTCANPTHPTCPLFVQHDGRWLDYDVCLVPVRA